MQPIKIIELTDKLTISDMERINELLKSSTKNKPVVLTLYNSLLQNKILLKKNYKHDLWKAMYGKKLLNENQFRKLCFELLQKTEAALTIIHAEQNEHESSIHLLKHYSSYNAPMFFENKWKQLSEKNQINVL